MEGARTQDIPSAFASPTFGADGSFEVNKSVGSMSISPCGRDVVLASREGLYVIDLDSPWAPPRHLPHRTPWEVADVQWSPFPARDHWVVSTSNQRALVWNLGMISRRASIEHYLHAHTRAITDINFSAHNPDMLATCAIDSFVHCWDLRHPARPAMTFCDWYAGATQVKWNRQNSHIIASAHDKFLRIWDERMGAQPLRSIEAHDTKIYGIDWNRLSEQHLITCSLDHTIKLWDYAADANAPERTFHTPFPIWRARHTPFGWGILAMPQRGNSNVYLYDRRVGGNASILCPSPIRKFEGHQGQVKEFLWRCRGSMDDGIDDREFQLVTWGTDRVLRLHAMQPEALSGVGYKKGNKADERLNLTRRNAPYKTFREFSVESGSHEWISGHTAPYVLHREHETGISLQTRTSGQKDRGWAFDGFLANRSNHGNKGDENRDLDPITWMKGVKIGKKDAWPGNGTTSLEMLDFNITRNWEEFESLGEEITHVGTIFSKVDFEEIDVKNRFVIVSMRGLLDSNEASSHLTCRFEFPTSYPVESPPRMTIEKTVSSDEALLRKLHEDVRLIGNSYAIVHRSSLEVLLRYLQGDQTLDEALYWSKNQNEENIVEIAADQDSSSDEEDESGGFNESQADEFGLSSSGLISATANINTPLPKTCGAVWAANGKLVCFFPPKEEKHNALTTVFGLNEHSSLLKGQRIVFDGFGNIHQSFNGISQVSSVGNRDETDSLASSDASSSGRSSSISSLSSKGFHNPGIRFSSNFFENEAFGLRSAELNKPTDETLQSAGSFSLHKVPNLYSRSVVSLHDLESLLPSARALATDYSNYGHKACAKNGEIALLHGREHLATVWSLMDLLLYDNAQYDLWSKHNKQEETTPISAMDTRSTAKKGMVGLRNNIKSSRQAYRRVSWVQHPFGASMLVRRLFDHFSQAADIQMLALMSCLLSDRCSVVSSTDSIIPGKHHQSLSRGASSKQRIAADYTWSPPVAAASLKEENSRPMKSRQLRKSSNLSAQSPAMYGRAGEPFGQNSVIKEAPADFRAIRWNLDGADNENALSVSPEIIRTSHKSAANLASAFASSLARPFSFSASASSSPPTAPIPRPRVSSPGSLLTRQNQVGWAESSSLPPRELHERFMAKPLNGTNKSTTYSRNKWDFTRGKNFGRVKKVTIQLKNRDQFQPESYGKTELLSTGYESQLEGFREAYASALGYWQSPVERAEILKYNDWAQNSINDSRHSHREADARELSIGQKVSKDHLPPRSRVVEFSVHCQGCGRSEPFKSGQSRKTCQKCHSKSKPLECVLCNEPVRGRASPCIKCGHVMHIGCRALWCKEVRPLDETCVTGCNCSCTQFEEAVVKWFEPERQSAETEEGHSQQDTKKKAKFASIDGEEKWKSIAEDLAYESLVKNLGIADRHQIRQSKSQVWRGRERRGASMGTVDRKDRNFWLGM